MRLPLHLLSNYTEGSIADNFRRFVEAEQRRNRARGQGGGYLMDRVDKLLEGVGGVEETRELCWEPRVVAQASCPARTGFEWKNQTRWRIFGSGVCVFVLRRSERCETPVGIQ